MFCTGRISNEGKHPFPFEALGAGTCWPLFGKLYRILQRTMLHAALVKAASWVSFSTLQPTEARCGCYLSQCSPWSCCWDVPRMSLSVVLFSTLRGS